MRRTPRSTLNDPQKIIADLKRQLAEAERRLDERTAQRDEYKAERDEALARERASAEVLGVINASPGDLGPVFDAMLEKAVRLCDATFGTMHTQDGDCFRVVALYDVPEEHAEFLK